MIRKFLLFTILVVGALWLAIYQYRHSFGPNIANMLPNSDETGQPIPINQDISELIKAGKSIKCNIKSKDPQALVGGTLYVYDQGYRTEVVTKNYDKLKTTYSIVKNSTMSVWSSDKKSGMSLDITKDEASKDSAKDYGETNIDSLKDNVTFECKTWKADTALFELPKAIEFIDLTMVLKKLQMDVLADCKRCEQEATKAGIAECKQVLNCKQYETMQSSQTLGN